MPSTDQVFRSVQVGERVNARRDPCPCFDIGGACDHDPVRHRGRLTPDRAGAEAANTAVDKKILSLANGL